MSASVFGEGRRRRSAIKIHAATPASRLQLPDGNVLIVQSPRLPCPDPVFEPPLEQAHQPSIHHSIPPRQVHSFDLVSPNPLVTACDMAHVPIKDASVHVAVFCLSLMGTNLADFLREAHRVLVPGGLVKVRVGRAGDRLFVAYVSVSVLLFL